MTTIVLKNAYVVVDDYDMSGDSNQLMFNADADSLDATVFNAGGWRSVASGLKSSKLAVNGFWQAGTGTVDGELLPDLGGTDRVVTFGPDAGVGNVAYLGRMGKFSTQLFGKVGDLAPFSLNCAGTDGVGFARGQVAAAGQVVSATGAVGSALNLGAVSATQKLFCSVHVLSAGTSLTLVLQSSPDNTFATPTTQATIGPLTAAGGTWVTPVAGPVTDTWYRLRASAVTGSFTVTAAIAVR